MDYQQKLLEGQGKLADTIKLLIYRNFPKLFETLDFDNDRIFTEPLLFSYFNFRSKADLPIEQILWSYNNSKVSGPVPLMSNEFGTCYIPETGYLQTQVGKTRFLLHAKPEMTLTDLRGNAVAFTLKPVTYINSAKIEITTEPNALFDNLFTDEAGKNVKVGQVNVAEYLPLASRAFEILRQVNPTYARSIEQVTRMFFLYSGTPNSFASITAHGAAFFNVQPGNGLIYFLDNIAHQCGHVVFNALTFEKSLLFTVPPGSPLSQFTKNAQDTQDIYGRFHGLFTQTNINTTIDRCLDQGIFEGDEKSELIGRFVSNMKRFSVAISKFDHPEMYTPEGEQWFSYFKETFEQLNTKWARLLSQLKVDNQPYVFDYKIFKESNVHALTNF